MTSSLRSAPQSRPTGTCPLFLRHPAGGLRTLASLEPTSGGPAMQVMEIMTREVMSVGPEASVFEVAEIMRDQDIGSVLVTEGSDLLGVITDRDIVVRAFASRRDL